MVRLRVAVICHFSNKVVREKLPLSKLVFQNRIRTALGKQPMPVVYNDYAPWVSSLIKEYETFQDIEVHVIAPHSGMTRFTHEFGNNGVYYHFFNPNIPNIQGIIPKQLLLPDWHHYVRNRFFVKRFLKRIKPDIVDLIGTENPYYSITALDIKDIPVYVTVQTVYTNPDRLKHGGNCDRLRWDIELKIHRKVNYYGTRSRLHHDLIINNNPDAFIMKHNLCKPMPECNCVVTKMYDFVLFAANIIISKGIEDAIRALAKVKEVKPDVRLDVVGSCAPEYKAGLATLVETLDLNGNVEFHGYFPLHADMFRHIQKASFAILPNKLDAISGTVIEAMCLNIPLVTYKTSGTPFLNKGAECVLLADIGDIDMLAVQMTRLLETPSLANVLARNAKAFVVKECDNTACAKQIVQNYKAVIDHYVNQVPIPNKLLFDIKEYPIY
jgi:glycosyltransferase involved in cell wall biosynthesis